MMYVCVCDVIVIVVVTVLDKDAITNLVACGLFEGVIKYSTQLKE